MSLFERKPTRIIFVRHLETPGTQQRRIMKKDPDFRDYEAAIKNGSLQTIEDVKATIATLGPLLRQRYHDTAPDATLPLLPGQEKWGRKIGEVVQEKYGPVNFIEVSPLQRAKTTLAYLQEGSPALSKIPVTTDTNLVERQFGDVDVLPFARLYYYLHPDALDKYYQDRENNTYPGAESRQSFEERGRKKARSYLRSPKYEGKTTLQVSHSRIIQKQIAVLLGDTSSDYRDLEVNTGSTTVLEAKARILPFTRRRYRVVALNERTA